ncbi:hypothetical protein OAK16_04040 [Verrucomicrobia bacterium]|nr:hypothetical protein [Verrucomicrobiota bacterium]
MLSSQKEGSKIIISVVDKCTATSINSIEGEGTYRLDLVSININYWAIVRIISRCAYDINLTGT